MNIVFDLDGTLIHSAPDLHAAVNKTLVGEGYAPLDLDTVTGFVGNGLPKLVERAMQARDVPMSQFPRLCDEMRDFYNAAPADLTEPMPGVPTLLERLKAAGYRLGICTNKPNEPTELILDLMGLVPYFDVIVGGDQLEVKKPDPAPLVLAFDQLGGDRCLFVGDSEVDAATARAAGVPFALFSGGYRKGPVDDLPHDYLFDHFDAVDAIVADCMAKKRVGA